MRGEWERPIQDLGSRITSSGSVIQLSRRLSQESIALWLYRQRCLSAWHLMLSAPTGRSRLAWRALLAKNRACRPRRFSLPCSPGSGPRHPPAGRSPCRTWSEQPEAAWAATRRDDVRPRHHACVCPELRVQRVLGAPARQGGEEPLNQLCCRTRQH